jgi:hypothetical protein
MTPFEIPLSPQAQFFQIEFGGVTYQLRAAWCDPGECWVLDINEPDGTPVLSGVPLVTGADLLDQFAYLGIGGQLIVQTDHDINAVPTDTNLGSTGHVYFVVA